MSKKWQILIVVVVTAVLYLGLFVGIPALAELCPTCPTTETTSNVSDNEIVLDSEGVQLNKPPSYTEMFKKVWIIYLIPGLVSGAVIATILKKKKEAK